MSKHQDFFNDLKKRTTGDVRTDSYSRVLYSTDASNYRVMPHGVLIPKTVDDIQAAMELAAQYQMPLLPRAAGSSLAGQAVNEALVIDVTRHLDQVLEVNAEEQWVRVQPGVVLDELNAQLKPLSLQFGPDPASSNRAAMGGGGGQQRLRQPLDSVWHDRRSRRGNKGDSQRRQPGPLWSAGSGGIGPGPTA
jgi:FAD/FMN-containing dehydrogenase